MRRKLTAVMAAALLMPAASFANVTPIPVDLSALWVHDRTGMPFPAKVSGFERTGIDDFGADQFDIAASYREGNGDTFATLYLFRAGLPDASIWHDRILAIMADSQLGHMDRGDAKMTAFTPPAAQAASGYRTTMAATGAARVKATAVAIFEHDDWLVSVRMSSKVLSRDELDARLAGFVAALAPGREKVVSPAAYLVAACAQPLPRTNAQRQEPDLMAALLAGSLVKAAQSNDTIEPVDDKTPPQHYCRDAASTSSYGVYRTEPTSDGYLIAFADAGTVAVIAPDQLGQMIRRQKNTFTLALETTTDRSDYAGFIGLPKPEQAIAAINEGQPISSSKRDGNATIFVRSAK